MLGQLPGGKLVLQGSQLAALTQARAGGQAGGQPKVLTIQLQVQQQPNQQGGVKVRKKCFTFYRTCFPFTFCFSNSVYETSLLLLSAVFLLKSCQLFSMMQLMGGVEGLECY